MKIRTGLLVLLFSFFVSTAPLAADADDGDEVTACTRNASVIEVKMAMRTLWEKSEQLTGVRYDAL